MFIEMCEWDAAAIRHPMHLTRVSNAFALKCNCAHTYKPRPWTACTRHTYDMREKQQPKWSYSVLLFGCSADVSMCHGLNGILHFYAIWCLRCSPIGQSRAQKTRFFLFKLSLSCVSWRARARAWFKVMRCSIDSLTKIEKPTLTIDRG